MDGEPAPHATSTPPAARGATKARKSDITISSCSFADQCGPLVHSAQVCMDEPVHTSRRSAPNKARRTAALSARRAATVRCLGPRARSSTSPPVPGDPPGAPRGRTGRYSGSRVAGRALSVFVRPRQAGRRSAPSAARRSVLSRWHRCGVPDRRKARDGGGLAEPTDGRVPGPSAQRNLDCGPPTRSSDALFGGHRVVVPPISRGYRRPTRS
jgi:hypothetical protein